MRTRHAETSDGEGIPFTKKELEEPSFIEHILHAEIHNNPSNQNNTRSSQNMKTLDIESNIQNLPLEMENNSENCNIDTLTSSVIIPPDLLHIINNLAKDLGQNEIYQIKDNCEDSAQIIEDNKNNPEDDRDARDNDCNSSEDNQDDQPTNDDYDEENERDEKDNDSDDNTDATYNELDTNETTYETEK